MCQKLLSRPKGQKVRPASQPDLRLAVVAVAPKSYFYPLQFKTSQKPRGCVANAHKNKVKLTFSHGASLPDPDRLFNAGLEGNARQTIDFFKGDKIMSVL